MRFDFIFLHQEKFDNYLNLLYLFYFFIIMWLSSFLSGVVEYVDKTTSYKYIVFMSIIRMDSRLYRKDLLIYEENRNAFTLFCELIAVKSS